MTSDHRSSAPTLLRPSDSARVFAAYRLLARGLNTVAIVRNRTTGWRPWALAGSTMLDLTLWRSIRRGRLTLPSRVGIDLADMAFWAGPGGADLVTALTPQVALDVEVGLAADVRGFGLPVASAALSSAARLVCGRDPDPLQNIPHAGAVIGGLLVRRGERRRLARALESHRAELEAKKVRAFLAGQQAVAMGVSSIIDQLKPVALLLDSDEPDSALNQVRAGWKEGLAEQARRHAVFLDSAVRMWQGLHNDHPDLSGYVDTVDLAEGDGTALLTGLQARRLADLLEELDLSGTARIELSRGARERATTSPGRPFELLVNGSPVTVPGDPDARIDQFNAAPPALFFGAWAALMPARPTEGDLPLVLAATCSAAYLAAALTYIGRPADETIRSALRASIALALLQGVVCGVACRDERNGVGSQLFSGTFGITPAVLLLAATRRRIDRSEQIAAMSALAAISGVAYLLAERPRSTADFVVALAHPVAAMIGMDVYATAAARETERLSGELRREDEDAISRSFEDGRSHVLRLAARAVAEAETEYERRRDLDPEVRESVAARLAAIRTLAGELGLESPPSARFS